MTSAQRLQLFEKALAELNRKGTGYVLFEDWNGDVDTVGSQVLGVSTEVRFRPTADGSFPGRTLQPMVVNQSIAHSRWFNSQLDTPTFVAAFDDPTTVTVLEGTSYKFVPSELTVKAGDVVRFHNVSGGPHNVAFWADSIPAGAAAVLNAGMKDRMGDLSGPMLVEANAVYEVPTAGAPVGEYKFYCLPHLAMAMHGKITVQ